MLDLPSQQLYSRPGHVYSRNDPIVKVATYDLVDNYPVSFNTGALAFNITGNFISNINMTVNNNSIIFNEAGLYRIDFIGAFWRDGGFPTLGTFRSILVTGGDSEAPSYRSFNTVRSVNEPTFAFISFSLEVKEEEAGTKGIYFFTLNRDPAGGIILLGSNQTELHTRIIIHQYVLDKDEN